MASLFFAGFAVSAFSAQAAPIVTDAIGLITGDEMIPQVDAPLPAYVARPNAKGRFPVVIVVSEVFGIHEYIATPVGGWPSWAMSRLRQPFSTAPVIQPP